MDELSVVKGAERPFLDYYAALGTTPVSQDISDLQRHLERRGALYQLLGIPPRFFALADVLEFGPGLGHNALAVAMLEPKRHVLVDANPGGLDGLRATLRAKFGNLDRFEIVEALAQEYRSDAPFDIVLAENMIPMQRDPRAFCRALAAHVRCGGVLVVTCMTSSSTMGETLRRLIALRVAPPSLALEERVARLRDLFGAHLALLPGVSRPVDDWIKDNITHPLIGSFFSIEDAIEAIGDEFDVYGGSPHFFTDWRWYKQIHGDGKRFNQRAIEAYRANVVNLMDWRAVPEPHAPELGERISERCDALFARMRAMEESAGETDMAELAQRVDEIARELAPVVPQTAGAFRDVAAYLRADDASGPELQLAEFAPYFGRGIQYVSFIRSRAREAGS